MILQTFLVSLIFPSLSFLAYYVLWAESSPLRARIARFKIRPDAVEASQHRFEVIWTTLYPFFSTALVFATTTLLMKAGISRVYFDFNERSLLYFAVSSVAYVLVADLFRYWCHRLMHQIPFLYERVHSWHHRSVNVNPLSTLSMHPIDLLSGTPWLLATNLFPVHISAVIFWANFYHLQNLHRHLGYDFWGKESWLGRVIISPRNHDLHHTKVGVNFGATFTIWDKLFGTSLDERSAGQE